MNGNLPEPRLASHVYGHQAAIRQFEESLSSGRLHHAWLISGPSGVGKATLAFHLARKLLGGSDLNSPAGRRISAGTHGDLLTITRKLDPRKGQLKGEITVSDVQPVQSFLHHTATEGGWRVVIVDGLETLNRSAANALLKILEEPPPKAVLLLTSSAPGGLLPTLRSRCRSLALSGLKDEEMKAVLPELSDDLLRRAHGSPGRALFLAQDRDGVCAGLVARAMAGEELDHENWMIINQLAREADGFALLCDLLGEALADQARDAAFAGDLARAAIMAERTVQLGQIRVQSERFNLDKAEAIREALALAR
ncbi:DNA polymerase III subunit delta' [Acetobacteraceae bacterium B3987]|nr:DNA polymerase III subunit delta' [Acetobacteraceae bacterium B3987]